MVTKDNDRHVSAERCLKNWIPVTKTIPTLKLHDSLREPLPIVNLSYVTLDSEMHDQMFQSSGQSDAKLPVLCSQHYNDINFPVRDTNNTGIHNTPSKEYANAAQTGFIDLTAPPCDIRCRWSFPLPPIELADLCQEG
ncbi:hypothetical protein TNCV_3673881 [Trichonephila clavipes]|nr:hypothetical protein TNCV_3673881 [Trichonephila clavipes]